MAANIKTFVVDASFVLSLLIPDESSSEADQIFHYYKSGAVALISTALLPFEVANGLKMAAIRNRVKLNYASKRLAEFIDYQIQIHEVDCAAVFELANKYNLTFYDASYLYLAKLNKFKLLSLDKKLQQLT